MEVVRFSARRQHCLNHCVLRSSNARVPAPPAVHGLQPLLHMPGAAYTREHTTKHRVRAVARTRIWGVVVGAACACGGTLRDGTCILHALTVANRTAWEGDHGHVGSAAKAQGVAEEYVVEEPNAGVARV